MGAVVVKTSCHDPDNRELADREGAHHERGKAEVGSCADDVLDSKGY